MNLLKFVFHVVTSKLIIETDHSLGIKKLKKKVIYLYYLKMNNLQVLDLFFYQTLKWKKQQHWIWWRPGMQQDMLDFYVDSTLVNS